MLETLACVRYQRRHLAEIRIRCALDDATSTLDEARMQLRDQLPACLGAVALGTVLERRELLRAVHLMRGNATE